MDNLGVNYEKEHTKGKINVPIYLPDQNTVVWVISSPQQPGEINPFFTRLNDLYSDSELDHGQVDAQTAKDTLSNLLNGAEISLITVESIQNEGFDLKNQLNLD